jgi:hypothetical protein
MAALALSFTAASAAPNKYVRHDGYRGKPAHSYQFVQVKRSAAHLAFVKRQAWADGRITFWERLRIRTAERQLALAKRRAYR